MEKWNALKETPKPETGLRLWVDSWNGTTKLEDCEWERADFRVEAPTSHVLLAVRVTVTGRTWQRPHGYGFASCDCVRVRVEFVGDGEDSRYASGWMEIPQQ